MLGKQGASKLLEKPKRPKQKPLCNYKATEQIETKNPYGRFRNNTQTVLLEQIEMTKAEYKNLYSDYKGTRFVAILTR